jgi:hypothetical protein
VCLLCFLVGLAVETVAALRKDAEEAVKSRWLAEEAECSAQAELEAVLAVKWELEASLQREQEACHTLRTDLDKSKDKRAVLQQQLEITEKDAALHCGLPRRTSKKLLSWRRMLRRLPCSLLRPSGATRIWRPLPVVHAERSPALGCMIIDHSLTIVLLTLLQALCRLSRLMTRRSGFGRLPPLQSG